MKLGILILISLVACSANKAEKPEPSEGHEANRVHISPQALPTLDIAVEEVKKQPLYEAIEATGRVIQDPEDVAFIFSPQAGEVQNVFVQVGDSVRKGQILMKVGNETIPSPRDGTVISLSSRIGERAGTLQSLMAIARIHPIRVVFDVYPNDMDRVKIGQPAQVYLIGHEESLFSGKVNYISPSLSAGAQSLKVGIEVENREGHLKYGMFTHGRILNLLSQNALTVPEEAVVRFGRETTVFVRKAPEEFEKRPVTLGRQGQKRLEILSGLSEGETVVTKGTFPLKSALQKHLLQEE